MLISTRITSSDFVRFARTREAARLSTSATLISPNAKGYIMLVRDILNSKGSSVLTIHPGANLAEAVQKLVEFNYGSLVVTEHDRMIGILSERDILRACAKGDDALQTTAVADSMTRDVVTGAPDDDVNKIMGVMTENRIRHLPVLDDDKLAGLISIGDIVKAQHAQLSVENHYLKSYIQS